ncbi:MAG: thrombospondin type 3 repeat-containing protein [Methanocellales archaeon]
MYDTYKMNNKKVLKIGLVFIALLLFEVSCAAAETICSYNGPDVSPDLIRLTNFSVSGNPILKVGDIITVKFTLQNYDQKDLNLGQKGIFAAARDPDNLDTSFGFTRSYTTLKYGETVLVEVSRVLDKAGTWKIWPSYHLSLKTGPDNWHACSLQVIIKDFDNDGISDDKDNCPYVYNPDQKDLDNDRIGDVCDVCDDRDSDQDGIKNCLDKCPDSAETYNQYQDEDGCPDEVPKKDTTPPTITISHRPTIVNIASNVTFTAIAKDNTGVSRIVIYVNRTQVKECTPPDFAQGFWRCVYTSGPYSTGTLTYKAEAFDLEGNNGTSERSLEVYATLEMPLREARLPCYISGTLYNFTYNPETVRVKFCEAESTTESIPTCKLGGNLWYVNVTPRWNISLASEVGIMNRAPREQGIRVDLSGWWRDVPPEREIEIDPVFSTLHLYWLDEEGNICSGIPGISGQPGTDVIYSASKLGGLRSKIENREPLSIEELRTYQSDSHVIDYSSVNYANLLQYSVGVWRVREDGELFEHQFSGFSLPIDVYLTEDYVSPTFTRPADAFGEPLNNCFSLFGLLVPSSGLGGQHPTKCRNQQNVSALDLIQACLEGRLNGSFGQGYYRIIPKSQEKAPPRPKPLLVYQSIVSCNGTYLIEPVCQFSLERCEWQGLWIPGDKSNLVVMNGTCHGGYDFTFSEMKKINTWDIFINFIDFIKNILFDRFVIHITGNEIFFHLQYLCY